MIAWHFAAAEQVGCVALFMPYSTDGPARTFRAGRRLFFSRERCGGATLQGMNTWIISDGTEVRIGGLVTGDGAVALRLRSDLALVAAGRPPKVSPRPQPSSAPLDLFDHRSVHSWVVDAARQCGERVVSHPQLPPTSVASVPDRVY